MGEKYNGNTGNKPSNGPEEYSDYQEGEDPSRALARLRGRHARWMSGGTGGLVGALCTLLFIVIPVINTWLANTKEVQVLQIKNTAEQIDYITKRMNDSDKERDLYKSEMLSCQKELRELKK